MPFDSYGDMRQPSAKQTLTVHSVRATDVDLSGLGPHGEIYVPRRLERCFAPGFYVTRAIVIIAINELGSSYNAFLIL